MNLAKVQFLSLATKGVTTALGIIQSIIIVRILSPAEFGLVGLVMSIGSVIGVSQHLGIVDGAIREIAIRKKKQEIGKVFWVSHLARQVVTIPLSLGLMLLAEPIAVGIYGRPEIVPYILIFAGALVLQGLQDVLGATLTGMKRFKALYIVQIITASINIGVFGYLTWQYGIAGFFWAVIITTAVMVLMFAEIARRELRGYLRWPSWDDVRLYGRSLMRIGAYMYLSRIFLVLWQRLPLLVLGGALAADELGYLNVSLTFGSKLTIVAMALSEVNLSWMSSLYVNKPNAFAKQVTRNMQRVLVLMIMMTLVLVFFAPEILRYIIGVQYLPAEPLILLVTCAFFLYALIDIGTSSLFVSADNPKLRAITYGVMTLFSATLIGLLLLFRPEALLATYVMVGGAALAYVTMIVLAKRKFSISLVSWQFLILLTLLAASVWWLMTGPALIWRIAIFLVLTAYTGWETYRHKLVPEQFTRILRLNTKDKSEPVKLKAINDGLNIICFAGAEYDLPSWTNRQHVMSRVAEQYPVLYIEPRVWILRYVTRNWRHPGRILRYFKRLFWYEKKGDQLYVKSQWNLLPGSRENRVISRFNHILNRWCVLLLAKWLGFSKSSPAFAKGSGGQDKLKIKSLVLWLYDTEAAEYLSAFKKATVVYDCVDDHAAQAGVDRNPQRVVEEEKQILRRADLVTVTSKQLFKLKANANPNTHLVLNAGDVELYNQPFNNTAWPFDVPAGSPIFGSVGALDAYKVDFQLLHKVARLKRMWQFVFIGAPIVDKKNQDLRRLLALENVHHLGAIDRRFVPAYVQQFDVCMIPYKSNRYNAASFPLKFWEFMATGKPIIATGAPELKPYRELIEYVKSPKEFIAAGERALKDTRGSERQKLASPHSWEKRTAKLLELLEKTVHKQSV